MSFFVFFLSLYVKEKANAQQHFPQDLLDELAGDVCLHKSGCFHLVFSLINSGNRKEKIGITWEECGECLILWGLGDPMASGRRE